MTSMEAILCEDIPERTTIRAIIRDASVLTGIPVPDIIGHKRTKEFVRVRQAVMWEARRQGYSLPQIGRALNRDHTTVIHGLRQVERRRQS